MAGGAACILGCLAAMTAERLRRQSKIRVFLPWPHGRKCLVTPEDAHTTKSKFNSFCRPLAGTRAAWWWPPQPCRCTANRKTRSASPPVSVGVSFPARFTLSHLPRKLPAGSPPTIIHALMMLSLLPSGNLFCSGDRGDLTPDFGTGLSQSMDENSATRLSTALTRNVGCNANRWLRCG